MSKDELPQLDSGLDPDNEITDESSPPIDAGEDMDSGRPDKAPLPDGSVIDDDAAVELDATVTQDASHSEDAAEPEEDAAVIDTVPLMCAEHTDDAHIQLGTPWEPLEHAFAAGPLQGHVDWRGRAFIRITGVTPGQSYSIVLSGDQLDLAVFDEEDAFGDYDCMSGTTLIGYPAVCVVTPTETTLDITVHAQVNVQAFELAIVPTLGPEGPKEDPFAIAFADLPRALATAPGQPSFYEITGVTPGTTYAVRGTPSTNSLRVGVFHPDFDHVVDVERTARGAIFEAVGTSLLVAVIGPGVGEVTLEVAVVSHESEGSIEAPAMLTADELPYDGEVGWAYNYDVIAPAGRATAESFYAITGLTPGDYVVSVSTVLPGLMLNVYGGELISEEVQPQCSVVTWSAPSLECGAHVDGSTLYLAVTNEGGDGSALTLDLAPAEYSTQGSELVPIELTRADLPYAGESLGSANSHYRISGLTPGKLYLVRASEQSAFATRLWVLDGDATTSLCEIGAGDEEAAQCRVRPEDSSLLVRIGTEYEDDGRLTGGSFSLDVIEIDEQPTSSYDYPIPIECIDGLAESTLSWTGASFYRISGLAPGVGYFIEARAQRSFSMVVYAEYPDDDPDQELCNAYGDRMYVARCLVAPAYGSVIVRVTGDGYGEPIELVVRRPHGGSEGTAAAPITVPIDQLPHAGRVATATPSYYAISGLTPGETYTLHIASAQEGVLVAPFGDLGMLNPLIALVATPGQSGDLQITAPTANLLLRVTLLDVSDWVTDISIDLLPE